MRVAERFRVFVEEPDLYHMDPADRWSAFSAADEPSVDEIESMIEIVEALMTFDGQVGDLERICEQHAPPPSASPEPESIAWYSRKILASIHRVRSLLASGDAEVAAAEAVMVGILAAQCEPARQWRQRQEQATKAGDRRGEDVSREAVRLSERVREEALKYRQVRKHIAYSTTHGTAAMATNIGRKIGVPASTVSTHLQRLKIK